MNRKRFLKDLGLTSLIPLLGFAGYKKAEAKTKSNKVNQVGFNHIKTMETKTTTSVLHKANTRGDANHGWLHSKHTFSFANYYNPDRMNFGVLRVLNDDIVAQSMGFGTHPHRDMEIISIPLEGDLKHEDNMGNKTVIKSGDVQVMSAGTGVMHSEYNNNPDQPVKFLQIWVFPDKKGVTPRYDQITLNTDDRVNQFQQVLSPNPDDDGVWVHQNAWFHMTNLDQGKELTYTLKDPNNGVYAFILEGEATINGQALEKRDGYGLWDLTHFDVKANTNTEILLMEVPMNG
jgi:redox-sensitive bicupin YhaK (pirin superfamily)